MLGSRRHRARIAAAAASAVAFSALAGCQYPRDVEGTLDRVRGGTMYVGVIEEAPWVRLGKAEPTGVEPLLLRRFARRLDARIEWVEGTEADLVEAMRGFQIDVLIGDLTRSSPYATDVALTRPYVDTEIEIGVPPGSDLPDDLGGVEILVERNSEAAALLRQEEDDAEPVFFDSLTAVDGPALLDSYEIEALGFESVDYILRDDEHAMAVPSGENAFLVELEHFLLDRGDEAQALVNREARRDLRAEAG